jgi:metal-responsive CopG/Arc/MetJ family transcriptional regulator
MATNAVRTTVSLPRDVIDALDAIVAAGRSSNRNEALAKAVRAESARMRREEIDRAIAAVADDPLDVAALAEIERDFDEADRESWAMLRQYDEPR